MKWLNMFSLEKGKVRETELINIFKYLETHGRRYRFVFSKKVFNVTNIVNVIF